MLLARTLTRWFLILVFAFAGYKHIASPGGFVAVTPSWVPDAPRVIFLTGLCEIAGAIGLIVPPRLARWVRPAAGIGLALYSVCVFPANINHAVNDIAIGGKHLSWWYHGPRLLMQPVIVWACLWASGAIDWPFKRR